MIAAHPVPALGPTWHETIAAFSMHSRGPTARENRAVFYILYVARVKVSFRPEADQVIMEGFGTGLHPVSSTRT